MGDNDYGDLLREGKVPLTFGPDGLPPQAHEPFYERMQFLAQLCQGYMRLYNRVKVMEQTRSAFDRLRKEGGTKGGPLPGA